MIATLGHPNEQRTLADFVRRHQRDLLRYARVLCAGDAFADDLVQDAFVAVWKKDAVSGDSNRDAAFLRKLVRDLWIDAHRRDRRRALRLADAADEVWAKQPDDDAWLDALAACRDTLTGRAAAAIAAVYDRGLGREQAAQELGIKPNGVKTLLQRTRALLKQCVEQRLQEEQR